MCVVPNSCTEQSITSLQIRPYLMADGGNVEFIEIDGPVVYLKLKGACGSCPSSLTTMTMGIKRRLMEKIPVRSPSSASPLTSLPQNLIERTDSKTHLHSK